MNILSQHLSQTVSAPSTTPARWLALALVLIVSALALAVSTRVEAGETSSRYSLSGSAHAVDSMGGTYRLDVFTIDGGGGTSTSADTRYRLQGTIGQSAAQPAATSPRYRLQGGFWPDGGPTGAVIFKSGFENP